MYEAIHQQFSQHDKPEVLFLHLLGSTEPILITDVQVRAKVIKDMAWCQTEHEFKKYFFSFVLLGCLLDDESRVRLMDELKEVTSEYPVAMKNTALSLINQYLEIAPAASTVLLSMSELLFE